MSRMFLYDLDIYAFRLGLPRWLAIFMIFIYPATWAICVYRFGNWIHRNCKIIILRYTLFLIYFILKRISEIFTGIEIAHTAQIKRGLFIGHLGGIIIGHGAEIGSYSSFHEGVTIGGAGRGSNFGVPKIGSRVYFGAGAKVIGKIIIGNDVLIGANAVVVRSAEDNAVLAGVPARILSFESSRDFIHYRKEDSN